MQGTSYLMISSYLKVLYFLSFLIKMNEKVVENGIKLDNIADSESNRELVDSCNLDKLSKYCEGIGKKEIYRIPNTQQDKVPINDAISKHVTEDLFEKNAAGKKKFKFWKKHPVKALSHFDKVCEKYGYGFMERSSRTSAPAIRILLRLRGKNKLEMLNKELEEKRKEQELQNAKVAELHKNAVKSLMPKKAEVTLEPNFIEEIKSRSQALAEEDKYKRELIKSAKEKGWLGVTIEEIDLDLTENYRKIAHQLSTVDEFDKDSLNLVRMLQSLRKDKMDIKKFLITTEIKMAELEEKKNLRKKITGMRLDTMDEVI